MVGINVNVGLVSTEIYAKKVIIQYNGNYIIIKASMILVH